MSVLEVEGSVHSILSPSPGESLQTAVCWADKSPKPQSRTAARAKVPVKIRKHSSGSRKDGCHL